MKLPCIVLKRLRFGKGMLSVIVGRASTESECFGLRKSCQTSRGGEAVLLFNALGAKEAE